MSANAVLRTALSSDTKAYLLEMELWCFYMQHNRVIKVVSETMATVMCVEFTKQGVEYVTRTRNLLLLITAIGNNLSIDTGQQNNSCMSNNCLFPTEERVKMERNMAIRSFCLVRSCDFADRSLHPVETSGIDCTCLNI